MFLFFVKKVNNKGKRKRKIEKNNRKNMSEIVDKKLDDLSKGSLRQGTIPTKPQLRWNVFSYAETHLKGKKKLKF